ESGFGEYIPDYVINMIKEAPNNFRISGDIIDEVLYYKLHLIANSNNAISELCTCSEVTEQLANRILSNYKEYRGYEEFAGAIKTKNYAYSRICRTLLHIVLDIKKTQAELAGVYEPEKLVNIGYARLLGLKRESSHLMKQIKIPVITKLGDATENIKEFYNRKLKELREEYEKRFQPGESQESRNEKSQENLNEHSQENRKELQQKNPKEFPQESRNENSQENPNDEMFEYEINRSVGQLNEDISSAELYIRLATFKYESKFDGEYTSPIVL
nr:nucleotidyltransferase family protein [Lachnospiraceae bacterium]